MRNTRIGEIILPLLQPKVRLVDGRTARPLRADYDSQVIKDESAEHLRLRTEIYDTWNRSLTKVWRNESEKRTWVDTVIRDEALPAYYEQALRDGLKRLYEILSRIPKEKRPNCILFPATSSTILAHAVRPVLEKLGISSRSYYFPTTQRITWSEELDEEELWDADALQNGTPQETARQRFLTMPKPPSLFAYPDLQNIRGPYNRYVEKKELIEEYRDQGHHIPTDLAREQLDYQLRQHLAAWHEETGLPVDQCRPLIIDDFVDEETTLREVRRALQRGGVSNKDITAFAFLGYDMPTGGVTRDLFGQERTHIGQAVYSAQSFPFQDLASGIPPLSGTFKRAFYKDESTSPYVVEELVEQPRQENISPLLTSNARENYEALKRGLRQKLRTIGKEVALGVK